MVCIEFICSFQIPTNFKISGKHCLDNKNTDFDCCTKEHPCGVGGGDCDTDSECAGDLICGEKEEESNNCQTDFPSSDTFWEATADCCIPKRKRNYISYLMLSVNKNVLI